LQFFTPIDASTLKSSSVITCLRYSTFLRCLLLEHLQPLYILFTLYEVDLQRIQLLKFSKEKKIGTLFHNEANSGECTKEATAREMAVAARDCSRCLQVYIFSLQLFGISNHHNISGFLVTLIRVARSTITEVVIRGAQEDFARYC